MYLANITMHAPSDSGPLSKEKDAMRTLLLAICTLAHLCPLAWAEPMPKGFTGVCYIVWDSDDLPKTGRAFWSVNAMRKAAKGKLSRVASVCVYVDGKKEGPEVSYHDYAEGRIREVTTYRTGKKHGRCIRYNSDGTPFSDGVYKDGEMWSGTFYVGFLDMTPGSPMVPDYGRATYLAGKEIKFESSKKLRQRAREKQLDNKMPKETNESVP